MQQFQQLAFPYKMTGDLPAVKQDDRNIVSIPFEQLRILRNVDHFDCKLRLAPTSLDHVLGAIAEMAVRFGINCDRHEILPTALGGTVQKPLWPRGTFISHL